MGIELPRRGVTRTAAPWGNLYSVMVKTLRLINFRAFKDFTITFGASAYLVGPNNAGKSTILSALRAVDVFLRLAHRRNPTLTDITGHGSYKGYPVVLNDFPALQDSVRYEFADVEAKLIITWDSGASLTAVWEAPTIHDRNPPCYFYLEKATGLQPRNLNETRAHFPLLGVIPALTPLDHSEPLLSVEYVRRNQSGRLASRHFRNQIWNMQLDRTLDNFLQFAKPWLPELTILSVSHYMTTDGAVLTVAYDEPGGISERELIWAGDGIQIWLQILFHVYRVMEYHTIVLDEPEVFLHPDLQRRLVRLMEVTGKQTIIATHSSEIVSEADATSVVLVDKSRSRGRRATNVAALEAVSSALGTQFNVRLAKALRSRVVLFVEGKDLKQLRPIFRTLGLSRLEQERAIAIIPLDGYSRSIHVEPFKWLCKEFLPDAIETHVLLDRDYRSDSVIAELEQSFEVAAINAHVWRKKELESYFLNAAALARATKCPEPDVTAWLNEITLVMENEVFGRMLDERIREEKSGSNHAVSITTTFKGEFDAQWADPYFRLQFSPPKQILSQLNERLQSAGLKAISKQALVKAHRRAEISEEMAAVFTKLEERLAAFEGPAPRSEG